MSVFAEATGDQLLDGIQNFLGRIAADLDQDFAALLGGQHDHAHDTLGVDLLSVLGQVDVEILKLAGKLDKLRGRAEVKPELVLDEDRLSERIAPLGCVIREIQRLILPGTKAMDPAGLPEVFPPESGTL